MKRPKHYPRPGHEHLESDEYDAYKDRELRRQAFRWHGKQCAKCGQRSRSRTDFEVHHRHYRTFGAEKQDDVVVLCKSCHEDLHRRLHLGTLTAGDAPLVDPEWADRLK